jgi:hypothetical protein
VALDPQSMGAGIGVSRAAIPLLFDAVFANGKSPIISSIIPRAHSI